MSAHIIILPYKHHNRYYNYVILIPTEHIKTHNIIQKGNPMIDLLKDIFDNDILVKLVLSAPRRKSQEVKRIVIRPVIIGTGMMYQAELHFVNKVTHINMSSFEAADFTFDSVNSDFKQVNIFTTENDIQILANKPASPRITKKKPSMTREVLTHNKKKQYLISEGEPCDFLIKLGVMDESGKVFPKHYSKFRQINRFLEIVDDSVNIFDSSKTLKIIDFGCGKSYLTFALYYYFKILKGRKVQITGLDLKKNVIDLCSNIANELNYNELKFELGDIADYKDSGCDMVVTLHACDTATDYALINAVNWNSKLILSVPCCQHELFKQVKNETLDPMLKHGIIKDKFTELITDGLRGLKLESKGYDVSMIEFTSLEHTSKNIMIKAVKNDKKTAAKMQKAQDEYERMKKEFNLKPCIDNLK